MTLSNGTTTGERVPGTSPPHAYLTGPPNYLKFKDGRWEKADQKFTEKPNAHP